MVENAYSYCNLWRAGLDKIFLIINCFSVTKRKVIEANTNTNDLNTWKGAALGQRAALLSRLVAVSQKSKIYSVG